MPERSTGCSWRRTARAWRKTRPTWTAHWLREVRSRVGPTMPIVGTLDPHANLSEAMVRTTDFLVAYRTNPHLDQRDRGRDAARVMARMLRHEIRPTQAAAFPPLAINIERQSTANSPCKECYEALDDMLDDRRLLSNSLLLGFPYADVPEMGTSVLVITNDEPELARKLADDFADYLRMRANDFAGQFIEVPAAIEIAVKLPGPVCLLDMGDNVGGGAPGDGTVLHRCPLQTPGCVGLRLPPRSGVGPTCDQSRHRGKPDHGNGGQNRPAPGHARWRRRVRVQRYIRRPFQRARAAARRQDRIRHGNDRGRSITPGPNRHAHLAPRSRPSVSNNFARATSNRATFRSSLPRGCTHPRRPTRRSAPR